MELLANMEWFLIALAGVVLVWLLIKAFRWILKLSFACLICFVLIIALPSLREWVINLF